MFTQSRCYGILRLLVLMALFTPCFNTIADNKSQTDLATIADTISQLIADNHYNPADLQKPDYLELQKTVKRMAQDATSLKEFVGSFNALWQNGPFSHVNLALSRHSAAATADYYDSFKVGGEGAKLNWQDKIAVLTVNTMMGLDTIDQINLAYNEITSRKAKALIIDLRQNPGGAFAIVPLVSHLLITPLDAGMFVSKQWNNTHQQAPNNEDVKGLTPWSGWSIKSFWRDVQAVPLTRIQFTPMTPLFAGPVYVLTSQKSASATEFAIDAMANLRQVKIIGERSAGKMLSQKMFDVSDGLQLALPIADYYSIRLGRIEGKGIAPDIAIPADTAMQMALALINGPDPAETTITSLSAQELN
jgi:carboxyl-terminal processing protease